MRLKNGQGKQRTWLLAPRFDSTWHGSLGQQHLIRYVPGDPGNKAEDEEG